MWSLPDINRLNVQAASAAYKARLTKYERGSLKADCDHCGKPADQETIERWFDVFSDDAKGVVAFCGDCYDSCGGIPEGYFRCDECERLFISNYTWENYYRADPESGELLCLPCAAERYIADPDNWLELTAANIQALTFERIRKAPHIIAVQMPIPKGIEFYGNVEFDGYSGGRLTGLSIITGQTDTPQSGVDEIRYLLRKLALTGVTRALLVLDATYQFAVSIGVYRPAVTRQ